MRRRHADKRDILPDPIFKSKLVSRFINKLMEDGKKSLASKMFYKAVDLMSEGGDRSIGYAVFSRAIENAKPLLEVKSRRVGGSNYQVPVEVRGPRKLTLAMRWLIVNSRARKEKSFAEKLAGELGDTAKGVGTTIKQRDELHRMAEANKAFSHYRW